MAKQTLLLVDNDLKSLRVMEVSLRNAGYVVKTARDGAEAIEQLKSLRPALVISDVSLPKIDGFALCRRVKGDRALAEVPFIFLTDERNVEAKIKGLELGADDYLTRPIYIKEITARVRMALMRRARHDLERGDHRRFFGDLRDMGIVDLLQMFEMGQKSGELRLDGDGRMWFRDGRLIDATAGTLTGEDAVFRLLTREEGGFEIDFATPKREETIKHSTQGVLIEGMRRIDEWGRMAEQLPPLDTIFHVDYVELSERLAELPAEVNALLRLFDGTRSALAVVEASSLPDLDALAAISRLYFEGIIYEVTPERSAPAPAPPVPAPSPDLGSWLSDAPTPAVPIDAMPSLDPGPPLPDETPPPEPRRSLVSAQPTPRASLVESLIAAASSPPRAAAPEPGHEPGPDARAPGRAPSRAPSHEASREPGRDPAREPPKQAPRLVAAETPAARRLQRPPSKSVHDSDTEASFYDGPDAYEDEEDAFPEEPREPLSAAAWFAIGLVAIGLVAGVSFLTLRDSVTPMTESRAALNSSWHKKVLAARPELEAPTPIEGDWTLPSEPAPVAPPLEPDPLEIEAPTGEPSATDPVEPLAIEGAPPADPAPTEAPRPRAPADLDGLVMQAISLHKKGDYRGAVQVYERALALAPNDDKVLVGYAKSLLERGREKPALAAARKAATANASNAQAHLIIGSVLQNQGKKEASIEAYDRYLKLAPRGQYADDVRRVLQGMR